MVKVPSRTAKKLKHEDTVVVGARIPADLAKRFYAKARARGYMNTSDALRDLIRAFVEKEEKGNAD